MEGAPTMMLYSIGTYTTLEPERRSSASYQKAPPRFRDTLDALPGPQAAAPAGYTVQKGDTLAEIVRKSLQAQGKPADNVAVFDAVQEVARQNKLPNANRLHIGQNLDLSALGDGAPQAAPPASLPALDVSALPQLPPQRVQAEQKVESTPLPAPAKSASSEAEAGEAAEHDHDCAAGGGGSVGKNLSLGPMASAFSAHRANLLSPGPMGGPSHALGRDLLAELQPEVRYPTRNNSGRPDLNTLIDSILSGKPMETVDETAAAVVPATGDAPWQRAVAAPTRLTSDFGPRRDPFSHKADFHDGLDLAAPNGSDIHPVLPGTVKFAGWKSGYGRVIIVDHGNGLESVYGHNSKNLVRPGDAVTENTVLGHVGSSGRATGPHLHLELRKNGAAIDPIEYFSPDAASGTTLARND